MLRRGGSLTEIGQTLRHIRPGHDRDLREGRRTGAAHAGQTLADRHPRRCVMTATLRQALADYLALRRALGFHLVSAGRLLEQFLDYLDDTGAATATTEHALAWAVQPAQASPHWWAIRLRAVRGFTSYLHGLDATVEVPPTGMIRCGPCGATPYLYSAAEIQALIQAAGALQPRLRAHTYQTLIGLLAVSGIRIGEAIALDDADFYSGRELLVIRHAKFNKQRLVPLHPTTVEALARYVRLRRKLLPRPPSPALFLSTRGTRLLHSNIGITFRRLLDQARIRRRSASCRPRIHDLRHSVAVGCVLDWYRDGTDVQAMLPRLSTYLGHVEPANTYWYLSAAPELMAVVGRRLDAHQGGRR
jgi:integrase/recombinase XerD